MLNIIFEMLNFKIKVRQDAPEFLTANFWSTQIMALGID